MRRASSDPDPFLVDLHGRLTYLEGVTAGLAAQCAQRVLVLRALRERLDTGTVERGLADLLFVLERESSAQLGASSLNPAQRAAYRGFTSRMQRLTGQAG